MKTAIFMIIGVIVLVLFGYLVLTDRITPSTQQQLPAISQQNEQKLKVEDIKVGTGSAIKSGNTIAINYVGTLTNGKVFSATAPNEPYTTPIGTGALIKGWDEGLIGMKVGGKRRLTIPPSLGYGDQQVGSIPPNSTLIFEVELVAIQ